MPRTPVTRQRAGKPPEEEPRGRPGAGRPRLSGATADDPLVAIQLTKVPRSMKLGLQAAAEARTWHLTVLVRKILGEWLKSEKKRKARRG